MDTKKPHELHVTDEGVAEDDSHIYVNQVRPPTLAPSLPRSLDAFRARVLCRTMPRRASPRRATDGALPLTPRRSHLALHLALTRRCCYVRRRARRESRGSPTATSRPTSRARRVAMARRATRASRTARTLRSGDCPSRSSSTTTGTRWARATASRGLGFAHHASGWAWGECGRRASGWEFP